LTILYDFLKNEEKYKYIKKFDYIINCIGIIKPFCRDDDPEGVFRAIEVNAVFPHRLARFLAGSKTKIIHITTDCVYSGKGGGYEEDALHNPEDVYGKTKSLGEVNSRNWLNIRCSVIGLEKSKNVSLLGWFLNQPEGAHLKGFAHHKWNGVTALQYAELCQSIIDKNSFNKIRKISHVHHYIPNKAVNKYELLQIIADVFGKKYVIEKVEDTANPVDRSLGTKISILKPVNRISVEEALKELKNYMTDNHFL